MLCCVVLQQDRKIARSLSPHLTRTPTHARARPQTKVMFNHLVVTCPSSHLVSVSVLPTST